MIFRRKNFILAIVMLTLALVPLTARATSYTWTGTTSNAWNLNANWGGSGFPNAYTDQASILGASGSNKPATLSTTALLGIASGTALTTSGTSALSPLDIASTGILGVRGNIANSRSSGTGTERITIEGILRNDAASSATTYTITGANGSIALLGGTISSLNGGIWSLGQPVGGYGTISAPFTNSSTITANSSGNTLHITGSSTAGGTLNTTAGAILSLESAITGANLSSGNAGELALNGATLTNFTQNGANGTIQLTGNSTLSGTYVRNNYTPFTLNGNTLNLSGVTVSGVTGGPALFAIGTGTLNNSGATATTIGNAGTISLAGGSITNTGGGTFTVGTAISGYGDILGPLTLSGSGAATASGGTLYVDANINASGNTMNTGSAATDILDLRSGTITGGFLYPSFSAGSLGKVYLDGATIAGSQLGSSPFPGGVVTVTNNSTLTGTVNSYAALGMNSGKQLNMTGSTLNLNTGSSFTNSGTLAIGTGTLNNTTAGAYTLGGAGSDTLAGGTISGANGFTNNNAVTGYGTISAPFTNNANVTLTGGTSNVTGTFTNQAGANLNVQTNPATFGTVTNNGTVNVQNAAVTWGGNFTNNGVYTSDPSTQTFNNLTVGSTGYLTAVLGDIYQIKGNFTNNSTQNTLWNTTQAALDFITGGTTSHTFALAGADMGQVLAGYTNNFAWGTLDLTGQTLSLLDGNISNTGTALYVGLVNGLTFLGNTVTDIIASNGIDVYYNPSLNLALNGHTFNLTGGGYLLPDPAPVPVPLTLLLVGTGLIPFIRLRKKGGRSLVTING